MIAYHAVLENLRVATQQLAWRRMVVHVITCHGGCTPQTLATGPDRQVLHNPCPTLSAIVEQAIADDAQARLSTPNAGE